LTFNPDNYLTGFVQTNRAKTCVKILPIMELRLCSRSILSTMMHPKQQTSLFCHFVYASISMGQKPGTGNV